MFETGLISKCGPFFLAILFANGNRFYFGARVYFLPQTYPVYCASFKTWLGTSPLPLSSFPESLPLTTVYLIEGRW